MVVTAGSFYRANFTGYLWSGLLMDTVSFQEITIYNFYYILFNKKYNC